MSSTSNLVEIFESGDSFEIYRDRVLARAELVSEMLAESIARLAETDLDLSAFRALPCQVRVLVLSEDWCGDCTDNLPILDRIARDTGKLNVRIASRDAHLDVMDEYLKYGKFRAIPLVLFLDGAGAVGGHFIERPESLTALRSKRRAEIHEKHPEFGGPDGYATLSPELRQALSDDLIAMVAGVRPLAVSEAVREFGEQATLASA